MPTKKNSLNKVIVTGATGFVGQNLIPKLLDSDYKIIAIGRNKKKAKRFKWFKKVEFIEMDIRKNNKKILVTDKTGLIHLAWEGLPNYDSKIHLENYNFSYEFIKSLVAKGLKQVLITGTCFEYGLKNGLKKSNMKTYPHNNYSYSKDLLRKHIHKLRKKFLFSFQWARLFYFYGKGQNENSLLPQLEKAIKKKDKIFNMSMGMQIRDYLNVTEVVQQIISLYSSQKAGVFNICSGKPITIKKLIKNKIKEKNSKIKLNLGYYPYNDYEPMSFWGEKDIDRWRK